jgi:hypothetical protein
LGPCACHRVDAATIKSSPQKSGDNVPRRNTEPEARRQRKNFTVARFETHCEGSMSNSDQIFGIDSPIAPRPPCPKCGMRMITVHRAAAFRRP